MDNKKARLIAYYLPQYHPIPENDSWWGKGFTEWTNVVKAKPLFRGHVQPKLPADLGFYDLRVPEVREQQAQLAYDHGIEGFSYWHYWFGNGKRILEKVFNEVLKSGKPDFPFCLAWANASWTGHWYGCEKKMLIEQKYLGIKDYTDHFYSVLPAFHDNRYIRMCNKPIFPVFNPEDIPNPKEFTDHWRNLAVKEGLEDIYFIAITNEPDKMTEYAMDGSTWHEPISQNKIKQSLMKRGLRRFGIKQNPMRFEYADYVSVTLNGALRANQFPLVMSNWDNTPRSGRLGVVFENESPTLLGVQLKKAIHLITERPMDERLVFVKSWNEWAEGNYLEPCNTHGSSYLDVIKSTVFDH